jgi:hypothetical protein
MDDLFKHIQIMLLFSATGSTPFAHLFSPLVFTVSVGPVGISVRRHAVTNQNLPEARAIPRYHLKIAMASNPQLNSTVDALMRSPTSIN